MGSVAPALTVPFFVCRPGALARAMSWTIGEPCAQNRAVLAPSRRQCRLPEDARGRPAVILDDCRGRFRIEPGEAPFDPIVVVRVSTVDTQRLATAPGRGFAPRWLRAGGSSSMASKQRASSKFESRALRHRSSEGRVPVQSSAARSDHSARVQRRSRDGRGHQLLRRTGRPGTVL